LVAFKKNKKKELQSKENIDATKFITYFLTIIICAGFLFNGYFFEHQSLIINILVGSFLIVLLVFCTKKQKLVFYNRPTFVLGFVFLLINFISIFFASDLRAGLSNFLLVATGLNF